MCTKIPLISFQFIAADGAGFNPFDAGFWKEYRFLSLNVGTSGADPGGGGGELGRLVRGGGHHSHPNHVRQLLSFSAVPLAPPPPVTTCSDPSLEIVAFRWCVLRQGTLMFFTSLRCKWVGHLDSGWLYPTFVHQFWKSLVEDEVQFLCVCSLYAAERFKFYTSIIERNELFESMEINTKALIQRCTVTMSL